MVNRTNYLRVKAYLNYLSQVAQLKANSSDRYRFYLRHLLLWADEAPFSKAPGIRPTFPSHLASLRSHGGTDPLAPSTLKKIVNTAKRFFHWAKATYPREFRGFPNSWIDMLRPPRTVEPAPSHVFVTLDEALELAALEIDEQNLALRRDQAGSALLYVSGMRAGALGSLPLEAVDVPGRRIEQWPSLGVRTKNGKAATTYLLEIPELLAVVEQWDVFVRECLPPEAMWYTPTISKFGQQVPSADPPGANRSVAIAKRMRKLFAAAGLRYKSPHKFRHGHAVYALQHAQTMADYKAVSMNLMHADIRVTDSIYAPLAGSEVRQRIAGLVSTGSLSVPADGDVAAFIGSLTTAELSEALIAVAERLARSDARQIGRSQSPVVGRAGTPVGLLDVDLGNLGIVPDHIQ